MYDEEHDGKSLRDLMLAAEVPPTRVDLHRAVATGRRRDRRRTIGISACAMLAVLTATGVGVYATQRSTGSGPTRVPDVVGAPPPACIVQQLAVPPGTPPRITGTDPTGRYFVGGTADGRPVIWTDGKPTVLAAPAGLAVAVNATGTVVGYAGEDTASAAWLYRNNTSTKLAKLAGYGGTNVAAINARGDVAGWVNGNALDANMPVVWPADHPGTVRKLKVPTGVGDPGTRSMRATGIGDDGTVIGYVRDAPVVWAPDGTPRVLPMPAGYTIGQPVALRGHYAYGSAAISGRTTSLIRWDLATGQFMLLSQTANGLVSGTPDGSALVEMPAGRVNLDGQSEALPVPSGASAAVALSVTDDGKTIVGMIDANPERPVVWHC